MAVIGTFKADKDGYAGTIRTLSINAKVRIVARYRSAHVPRQSRAAVDRRAWLQAQSPCRSQLQAGAGRRRQRRQRQACRRNADFRAGDDTSARTSHPLQNRSGGAGRWTGTHRADGSRDIHQRAECSR